LLETSLGTLTELAPFAYQVLDGKEQVVKCQFILKGKEVSFAFPEGYNPQLPLVIDPELVFSTYSGSTGDNWGLCATYDEQANAYLAGNMWVFATGYPVTPGAFQSTSFGGEREITISKFDSTGSSLLYATYLGGTDTEIPYKMQTDSLGRLWLVGATKSADFPVLPNAYDPSYNGDYDLFVACLSADGSQMLASTYLGGVGSDGINENPSFSEGTVTKYNYGEGHRADLWLSPSGELIVATCSQTADFPIVGNVSQSVFGGSQDAVIVSLNQNLSQINWSTFLGGLGVDMAYSLAYLPPNSLFVAGGTNSLNLNASAGSYQSNYQGGRSDGFLAKLALNTGQLLQQTYLGTADYDQAQLLVGNTDELIVYGQTLGAWPIVAPAGQGIYQDNNATQFVAAIDTNLNALFYSTTFGSPNATFPNLVPSGLGIHPCGGILLAGWGGIANYNGDTYGLRTSSNALKDSTDGNDFYIAYFGPQMDSLYYATYFGGHAPSSLIGGEHVDGAGGQFSPDGVLYHAACAQCGNPGNPLPTTPNSYSPITGYPDNCNAALFKFDLGALASVEYSLFNNGQMLDSLVCAPATIDFVLESGSADSYTWNFGDGSPLDSTASPSHTFSQVGDYQVSLLLSEDACDKDRTQTWLISVLPSIDSPLLVLQNATLCITNPDSNAVAYLWEGIDSSGANNILWQSNDACLPDSIWAIADTLYPTIKVSPLPSACGASSFWEEPLSIYKAFEIPYFELYPNPAEEELYLDYALGQPSELKITLLNLQGQRLGEIQLPISQYGRAEIPIRDLSAGMYWVSLQQADEIHIIKWIKR
ncbi:MAG: PKD domain-containing protein, partial [Bacteroidota bacterium]